MSGHRETSGVELGVSLEVDEATMRAAARTVADLGYGTGQLDAGQARDALEMIGFLPYVGGGKFLPTGKRATGTSRALRRQAAKRLSGSETPRTAQPHPVTPDRPENAAQSHTEGRNTPTEDT